MTKIEMMLKDKLLFNILMVYTVIVDLLSIIAVILLIKTKILALILTGSILFIITIFEFMVLYTFFFGKQNFLFVKKILVDVVLFIQSVSIGFIFGSIIFGNISINWISFILSCCYTLFLYICKLKKEETLKSTE